jgi:hypothetical protein
MWKGMLALFFREDRRFNLFSRLNPSRATILPMQPLSLRTQLNWVAVAYAAVVAFSTALVIMRYLLYVTHPEDVAAAGGMYAAGDSMLAIFIVGLLLIPTLALVIIIRNSEAHSITYAKVLLGISATAPICLGLGSIPAVNQSNMLLGYICMYRLLTSPVILVALLGSWLLARFQRAKRVTSYALIIEFLTLVSVIGFLVYGVTRRS